MAKSRAQVSVEFLLVVGMMLLVLTPLWFSMFTSVRQEQEELRISQAKTALSRIVRAADLVYVQGAPASTTIVIYIPAGINSSSLADNETYYRLLFKDIYVDVVEPTRTKLTGQLPTAEGLKTVTIRAEVNGYVNISSGS